MLSMNSSRRSRSDSLRGRGFLLRRVTSMSMFAISVATLECGVLECGKGESVSGQELEEKGEEIKEGADLVDNGQATTTIDSLLIEVRGCLESVRLGARGWRSCEIAGKGCERKASRGCASASACSELTPKLNIQWRDIVDVCEDRVAREAPKSTRLWMQL